MNVSEAVEKFLVARRVDCSASTVAWYGFMLRSLPECGIELLSVDSLERWVVGRRESGLSASSVGGCVRAVKAFCRWCVSRGYLGSSPALGLRGPRFVREPRFLTQGELCRVLAVLDGGDWPGVVRDRAFVRFLAVTGCRISEVVSVRVEDCYFGEGYARVIGKGNKSRRVGLTGCVSSARDYLRDRDRGVLFLSLKGEPMTRYGGRQILRRLSDRVGMYLHPHLFRYTFGTQAVLNGMDPAHVQILLGHSRIETTDVYVRAARASGALAAEKKYGPLVLMGKGGDA